MKSRLHITYLFRKMNTHNVIICNSVLSLTRCTERIHDVARFQDSTRGNAITVNCDREKPSHTMSPCVRGSHRCYLCGL